MNLFKIEMLNATQYKADANIIATLKKQAKAGLDKQFKNLPIFQNAVDDSETEILTKVAGRFKKGLTDIIHIGVGGSSLGAQAISQLTGYGCVGFADKKPFNIHFLDNLDARSLEKLLEHLSPETTGAIIVSKSGTTIDTIAIASVYLSWSMQVNDKAFLAEKTVIITEPHKQEKNPIRAIGEQYGMTILDHHLEIGGRYSVLSNVGLFVAALFELSVRDIKKGAQAVIDDPKYAIEGAAFSVYLSNKGYSDAVLWAYMDRLKLFTAWYVQLWAESLGKDGKGTTPIASLGPVDQHSQQQLFIDGPKNKYVTFLTKDQTQIGHQIKPDLFDNEAFEYLNGKTIGDVVTAQQIATATTLSDNGIPVRFIDIKKFDAETMGALLMHFMCETIASAELMNVNAFDQPAVEQSKYLAKTYLSR